MRSEVLTMFISRAAPRLGPLCRATGALQSHGRPTPRAPVRQHVLSTYSSPSSSGRPRSYSTAAGNNTWPPRWVLLEPELEEALVPRKLAVTPLESWLSLRYSLPVPLIEAPLPQEEEEEKVLPPSSSVPLLDDGGEGSAATPLGCKNVLKIRRRKMNRHKYKKLLKRTKFLRRRVLENRRNKKQKRFEKDLTRIWKRAGLKKAPDGWTAPKIFIKQYGNKSD